MPQTTLMHPTDANAFQARMEEIALREWEARTDGVYEYIANYVEIDDLIALLFAFERGSGLLDLARIESDWINYRASNPSIEESVRIEQQIAEEE